MDRTVTLSRHEAVVDRDWLENIGKILLNIGYTDLGDECVRIGTTYPGEEEEQDAMWQDINDTWRMPCGCTEATVLDDKHNACIIWSYLPTQKRQERINAQLEWEKEMEGKPIPRGTMMVRLDEDFSRFCVREDNYKPKANEMPIIDRAHEEGSFAYMCDHPYCRCKQ